VDPNPVDPNPVDPNPDGNNPDGNNPGDEAGIGGGTDITPKKDNSVVIAVTVISVLVALACVGGAIVVIMKRR
ncbi:MAG TPA: hypothetical protein DD415_07130, partial [Clostridiales bacterium]|nr:hypothetical protein [Clostridiales bacterium]